MNASAESSRISQASQSELLRTRQSMGHLGRVVSLHLENRDQALLWRAVGEDGKEIYRLQPGPWSCLVWCSQYLKGNLGSFTWKPRFQDCVGQSEDLVPIVHVSAGSFSGVASIT